MHWIDASVHLYVLGLASAGTSAPDMNGKSTPVKLTQLGESRNQSKTSTNGA